MEKRGINSIKTTSAMSESSIVLKNNDYRLNQKIKNIFLKYSFALLILCLLTEYTRGQITFTKTDAGCNASNGSATVSVNGGTPPYIYRWSTGGTGTSIHNLARGTYTCLITDASGCTGQGSVFVDNATDMDITISGGNVTTTYCNNTTPPSITLTATVTGGNLLIYAVGPVIPLPLALQEPILLRSVMMRNVSIRIYLCIVHSCQLFF